MTILTEEEVGRLHPGTGVCFESKARIMLIHSHEALRKENARLEKALGNINRMKRSMDSGINAITLSAAIEIAQQALSENGR